MEATSRFKQEIVLEMPKTRLLLLSQQEVQELVHEKTKCVLCVLLYVFGLFRVKMTKS